MGVLLGDRTWRDEAMDSSRTPLNLLLCYTTNMKDTKNRNYWFKRRRYGYGWTPVTWQGWSVVAVFLAVVVFAATVLLQDTPRNTVTVETYIFVAFVAVATSLAVIISRVKGPKPKWRWGSKPTDNPNEDI